MEEADNPEGILQGSVIAEVVKVEDGEQADVFASQTLCTWNSYVVDAERPEIIADVDDVEVAVQVEEDTGLYFII